MFKTICDMVLIQVAYGLAFSVLLYRSFISTIPRDLDEAAQIDGGKSVTDFPEGDSAPVETGNGDAGHGAVDCDFQRLH